MRAFLFINFQINLRSQKLFSKKYRKFQKSFGSFSGFWPHNQSRRVNPSIRQLNIQHFNYIPYGWSDAFSDAIPEMVRSPEIQNELIGKVRLPRSLYGIMILLLSHSPFRITQWEQPGENHGEVRFLWHVILNVGWNVPIVIRGVGDKCDSKNLMAKTMWRSLQVPPYPFAIKTAMLLSTPEADADNCKIKT